MVMDKFDINMAVAIFGGTFDPVHYGHIRVASDLADHLDVNSVALMPCGKPTHRPSPAATPSQRLDMLKLSIVGNQKLTLEASEIDTTAPNYTINSLRRIRSRIGAKETVFLCIGSDTFSLSATIFSKIEEQSSFSISFSSKIKSLLFSDK